MCQSDELRPVWACSACSGRSLASRAVGLTFPCLGIIATRPTIACRGRTCKHVKDRRLEPFPITMVLAPDRAAGRHGFHGVGGASKGIAKRLGRCAKEH